MYRLCAALTLSLFLQPVFPQLEVSSPNGKIVARIEQKDKLEPYPNGLRVYLSASYQGRPLLLDSPIRLDFEGADPLGPGLTVAEKGRRAVKETWTPLWGTHSKITDYYNELELILREPMALSRRIDLVIRVFDDGIAFRYVFPVQPAISEFQLLGEKTQFHFPGNPTIWATQYDSYATHQESEFKRKKLSQLQAGDIIGCPLLMQTDAAWVALTEAELSDWAGLYWTGTRWVENAVSIELSPRLDQPEIAVKASTPHQSPWRVLMVGDTPGSLIESNLILNLNPPNAIEDPAWIKPGISSWDRWWCGSYGPDLEGKLGMDNRSMEYFVDLSSRMGWEYQLVDWTWYGPPFDPARPFGTAGNPAADLTRSVQELDVPKLVEYARQRGVGILLWLDWFNTDRQMEQVFPLYEQWGIAGIKVDFMARDDQEMVRFYRRLVELAAKHRLVVDLHGAYKPTGLRRTYPNLLTREGVLGNEYNKWSSRITPEHNVTLPFTRMLCGPMDFTPGGFRNKTQENFRIVGADSPGPFVMGTRCHQLAMMVVYESPLQVMCDSPYSYRMSPAGLDFLKEVPTTWDDSRVLDGYPGQFIVMARRAGEEWYLGAMSGNQAKSLTIPLGFLDSGLYRASIYADAEEVSDYPERFWESSQIVTNQDQLHAEMATGGGYVARLKPVE